MNAQAFGKYQLLKKLATGGMAEVWLARQTGIEGFQRLLVVKRILPHLADDPEFVQMFLNEAKIAARFSHPNIAQIFDLGEMNGTYFIAMEFVHGEDLGRVMRKAWSSGQWIARPLSIRIVAGACEGLHYAHNKQDDQGRPLKVVHRDISPQNILISFDGSVKLVDFGIAKAADQASLTKSGAIKGKFAYMSPEQAAGKPLDNRSDIFSIGLVLYELLTGVRPLKRDSELATLQAALECNIEPPSKVADVPEDLDPVVMKALAKAADDRYRDSRTFQMALEEFLVSQRWVASSVQLSELMETLFADRLAEEAKLGHPDPETHDTSAPSGTPMAPLPPESTDSVSRTDHSGVGHTDRGSAEASWDAPPGQTEMRERAAKNRNAPRTMSRSSVKARGEGESTEPAPRKRPPMEPPPDMPAWDAPPSDEVPMQRRRTGEQPAVNGRRSSKPEQTAVARSSSEVPRARSSSDSLRRVSKPVPRQEEDEALGDDAPAAPTGPAPEPPPRRRPSSGDLRRSGNGQGGSGEMTLPPDDVEPPRPTSLRKRSSGNLARSTSKPVVQEVRTPPKARSAKSQAVPVPEATIERRPLPLKPMLIAAVVVIFALICFIFRKPIVAALTSTAADGQAIYLTVESNLPVHASVRHHQGCPVTEPVTELGEVPLRRVAGAHVRDTLILKLETQDVYYEQEIPYGEPGETKRITKEFKKGYYELNLAPPTLRNISVHLNSASGPVVGKYPGAKIELVEGTHRLVLTGDQLTRSGEIEADVKPGQTVKGKPYDLKELIPPP